LFSRVQSCFVPPQFNGLSLYLMVRFSASTASAKLKICFGWPVTSGMQAFAGIDAIPAAADHGLAVVGRDAAITLCGVSLHQVQACRRRRLQRASIKYASVKKSALRPISAQSEIFNHSAP